MAININIFCHTFLRHILADILAIKLVDVVALYLSYLLRLGRVLLVRKVSGWVGLLSRWSGSGSTQKIKPVSISAELGVFRVRSVVSAATLYAQVASRPRRTHPTRSRIKTGQHGIGGEGRS